MVKMLAINSLFTHQADTDKYYSSKHLEWRPPNERKSNIRSPFID